MRRLQDKDILPFQLGRFKSLLDRTTGFSRCIAKRVVTVHLLDIRPCNDNGSDPLDIDGGSRCSKSRNIRFCDTLAVI
jgi:hypothetical protein